MTTANGEVRDLNSTLRRAGLWLPPLVYMAGIFFFSAQSRPVPVVSAHVWDKLLHFVAYGGLGGLFYRASRGEGLGWTAAFAAAAIATTAYGASDEWHQSFVPLRDASIRDWFADALGGTIGAALYGTVSRGMSRIS